MAFETKIRDMMRDLVAPIIEKNRVDRELIFKLGKKDDDFESRVDLLEQAVYKKDPETGESLLFEQMEKQILEMSIDLK